MRGETQQGPPVRVVVIAPVLARHDAISQAAADSWRILSSMPGVEVAILALHSERDDVPVTLVSGLGHLLRMPAFLRADLLLYHFGLHNELFDAMLIGNGRGAKQVVRFHNVTPAEFLRPQDAPLIARSLAQLHNFRHADAIWADSPVNLQSLDAQGVPTARAEVIPLVVNAPDRRTLAGKRAEAVELVFIGRFVQSKGVLDLIQALSALRGRSGPPWRLRLAGNQTYSHPEYVKTVQRAAETLDGTAEFLGSVDDVTRDRLLQEAHILAIPSYHEGFCKPVVEALRAGCVPVGYAAYSLPDTADGLGRLVPPGDIPALSTALGEAVQDLWPVARGDSSSSLRLDCGTRTVKEFDCLAAEHVRAFSFDAVRGRSIESIGRLFPARFHPRRLPTMWNIRPVIQVLPDDAMREQERSSLNRLPSLSDWEANSRFVEVLAELRQPVLIHRKAWEYALCIQGLESLGVVRPSASGLAVGAGSESPLFYFANMIERMVATDLYDNEIHEGTPAMLRDPESFAPFPYQRDRLKVFRMPGDALEFPDGTFDFVFCLSSIEHFGSRATQRRSLDEMARVLKPHGVACIITELILTDHSDAEYFRWEEIEEIFLAHPRLRLEGGAPDLSISESLISFPVNLSDVTWPLNATHLKRLGRSPHIVLRRGEMLWTSFSMFLRRTN